MPIRAIFRRFYRGDWPRIRRETLEAQGYRCAGCGRTLIDLADQEGRIHWEKLHVSHNDHDPRNRRPANLIVRCTSCHNRHDAAHKTATRRRTMASRHGQLWLWRDLENAHLPEWLRRALRSGSPEP